MITNRLGMNLCRWIVSLIGLRRNIVNCCWIINIFWRGILLCNRKLFNSNKSSIHFRLKLKISPLITWIPKTTQFASIISTTFYNTIQTNTCIHNLLKADKSDKLPSSIPSMTCLHSKDKDSSMTLKLTATKLNLKWIGDWDLHKRYAKLTGLTEARLWISRRSYRWVVIMQSSRLTSLHKTIKQM